MSAGHEYVGDTYGSGIESSASHPRVYACPACTKKKLKIMPPNLGGNEVLTQLARQYAKTGVTASPLIGYVV